MTSSATQFLNREIPNTLNWAGRARLTAGVVICWLLFTYGSRWIGLPTVTGMAGCLIGQPSAAAAFAMTGATLLVCTIVSKFVVGDLLIGIDLQFEGGLIAVALGAFALAFRLGPSRYAMFQFPNKNVFLLLIAELLALYAMTTLCWLILRVTARKEAVHSDKASSIATKLGATLTHAVVMLACLVFLAQSDATPQSLAAVGISAWLASMAAHIAFPVRSSFWYWLGPLLAGVVGYAIAYTNPDGLPIGFPSGALGALARPTPLDFATAGPAGAIFGFWIAYRWNNAEEIPQSATAQ
jgi:hypothetical protein